MARLLTPDEIARYRDDGVVLLKQVVAPDTTERILAAVDELMDTPSRRGGNMTRPDSPGRFFQDRHLFPHHPEFASFLHDTELASVAAQAMGSDEIRVYFDHVFVKDPGTQDEFVWHQDRPYWAVDGTQVCSTWLALTPSSVETSALEFVKGSHHWDRTFKPEYPAMAGASPEELERHLWKGLGEYVASFEHECPAFEEYPDRYDILGFTVEPGDALLFDFRTVHRSGPNSGAVRRAAVSWRWLGDDAVWDPKPGADPIIGPDDTILAAGDRITDNETFPLVHP